MRLTHYFIVIFGFLILGGCVSNTYVTDPQIERNWAVGRLSERPPEFLRASLVMGLRLGDSTAEFPLMFPRGRNTSGSSEKKL